VERVQGRQMQAEEDHSAQHTAATGLLFPRLQPATLLSPEIRKSCYIQLELEGLHRITDGRFSAVSRRASSRRGEV
jgi:hypothetical protein